MMQDEIQGQCLCGKVTMRGRPLGEAHVQACHCGQCRRWTGGSPFLCVPIEDVSIDGAEHIERYHASEWGERGFCRTCGTTLFWSMKGKAPNSIAVGLLEDQSGLRVTEEIFTDRRAPWQPAWDGASQSTEAQEFAKLNAYMAREAGKYD